MTEQPAPQQSGDASNTPRGFLRLWVGLGIVAGLGGLCAAWAFSRRAEAPVAGYEVVNTYPHDGNAFTQGLIYSDGHLYEGTGLYGESTLRKVDLKTGRVVLSVALGRQVFGEGITRMGDEIFQLTWKSRTGFVYDAKTFNYKRRFRYSNQGWGLTHDGKHLILSDGTSQLRFIDPKTNRLVKRLRVTHAGRPLGELNELEYIDGEIFANVWHSNRIARISPKTGQVTSWIDLRGLLPAHLMSHEEAVLNGIAWDEKGQRLFVTGKNWPRLYEIRVVEPK